MKCLFRHKRLRSYIDLQLGGVDRFAHFAVLVNESLWNPGTRPSTMAAYEAKHMSIHVIPYTAIPRTKQRRRFGGATQMTYANQAPWREAYSALARVWVFVKHEP